MSTAELTTYTAEDLLHMPNGDRYELVGGQLVETEMGNRASWIAGNIHTEPNIADLFSAAGAGSEG